MSMPENFEQQPLKEFSEKAYLDYSMYVILDRALPHLADGLKPVQRRIIFAMSELGLSSTAKYKKSARTVGDALGKYHPHGDLACYEAMVLMAQPFSYRYPLVDGQGNWGSPDDPKSFAAMRYTESRLTGYANTLLAELGAETVQWTDNFDATLKEPELLPARLPNILLNGTTGIAVGMATDIPPHNLREVVAACIAILDNPECSFEMILQFIPAPDYPTEAEIITRREDIATIYRTGGGSLRMRATYVIEEANIVITALPHQVSGAKLLKQIAEQIQAKKLPMIEDLRDESDHENATRLVIIPRGKRFDVEALMAHLFATTDLEKSYRINMNMIGLNGKPQVKNLQQILVEWLTFRIATVEKRLQYRLNKIVARLHLLAGLLIAYLQIDEVIVVIREEETPKLVLIARFGLSELQAEAILELKLRHLAKLEHVKLRAEQNELDKERVALETTLASPPLLKALVKKELLEDAAKYGDARRSPLVVREDSAQAVDNNILIANEPLTIILSQKGWIRAAKSNDIDVNSLSYRAGDSYLQAVKGSTIQPVCIFDNTGRVYTLTTHDLPSARTQGEPLTGRLNPPAGASFHHLITGNAEDEYLLSSNDGYGFRVPFKELQSRNKVGKVVINLTENAKVLPPLAIRATDTLLGVVTLEGRLLIFAINELPELTKGKGNKMIQIPNEDFIAQRDAVIAMVVFSGLDSLCITAGKRQLVLKMQDIVHYTATRAKRGTLLPKGFQRVETITVV